MDSLSLDQQINALVSLKDALPDVLIIDGDLSAIITQCINSLSLLKSTYGSKKQDVIVSMSMADYKEYLKFLEFQKFSKLSKS